MNKLSLLVVSLFLLLGGLLWEVASLSLPAFINAQISHHGPKITQFDITADKVDVNFPITTIDNLTIGHNNTKLFEIANITLTITPDTLKESAIIIEQVIIQGVNNIALTQAQQQQLLANITDYLAINATQTMSDKATQLPNMQIAKVELTTAQQTITIDVEQTQLNQAQAAQLLFSRLLAAVIKVST